PSIRITGLMPELPDSPPPIFALPVPRVNERTLLNLARRFKLKAGGQAGSILRDALTFTYSEGAFDLTLHHASGASRFKNSNRWQVDHEGKLTCLDHISRRIGRVYRKVTELHSPEHAVQEASRMWEKRGVVGEVEIGEVRFCYYELGWNDEQRYLQPAYFVLATLIGPDKRIRTGDIHATP